MKIINDTKKKVLTIIGLLIFCVIIISPPLIYGYEYPNIGDDSAEHLRMMDEMIQGKWTPIGNIYLGFSMISYPIIFIHNGTGIEIDTLYLWFTYIALIGCCIVLYYVISRLVNKEAGILAVVITIFCTQGLMFLFYYGVIFNLINIGIILPLAVYFAVKYLSDNKWVNLLWMVVFMLLFTVFHTTGIYVSAVVLGLIIAYVLYGRIKGGGIVLRNVLVGVGLVLASGLLLWFTVPDVKVIVESIVPTMGYTKSVPILEYIGVIISMSVMILIVVLAILARDIWTNMNNKAKMLMCILGCVAVLLGVSAFTRLSGDPWRQALDMATMIALIVAIMLGVYLCHMKKVILWVFVIGVISISFSHNIVTWFQYNSAVTLADKEAIEYINNLDYEKYNCSSEIAPWIYGRYLDANYTDFDCDLLIVRNYPMTPRSTEGNLWFNNDRIKHELDNSYDILKIFRENEITVQVAVK